MSVITYLEYPEGHVPAPPETAQVVRFLVSTSRWIQPKSYGSGEADLLLPKMGGEELADFLVSFREQEGSLTLEEKRKLQLIIAPPKQTLPAGDITWEAPASHSALERSAHMSTVWHLMHLTGAPVAEAMSTGEQGAFTNRIVQRDGYEEMVRTVRGNHWGLRHAFWRMWFGAPYVKFFGKDRLEEAPAFYRQVLEPDGFFVQVYEDPEEWSSDKASAACKAFEAALGRKAFYNPKSPDDKLETPFD
jgi:hypothetical protein